MGHEKSSAPYAQYKFLQTILAPFTTHCRSYKHGTGQTDKKRNDKPWQERRFLFFRQGVPINLPFIYSSFKRCSFVLTAERSLWLLNTIAQKHHFWGYRQSWGLSFSCWCPIHPLNIVKRTNIMPSWHIFWYYFNINFISVHINFLIRSYLCGFLWDSKMALICLKGVIRKIGQLPFNRGL